MEDKAHAQLTRSHARLTSLGKFGKRSCMIMRQANLGCTDNLHNIIMPYMSNVAFCHNTIPYQKGLVLQYQLHNRVEHRKVFNPVVKLVLENQPFLMPEPAEKPSLHYTVFNSWQHPSCMQWKFMSFKRSINFNRAQNVSIRESSLAVIKT